MYTVWLIPASVFGLIVVIYGLATMFNDPVVYVHSLVSCESLQEDRSYFTGTRHVVPMEVKQSSVHFVTVVKIQH